MNKQQLLPSARNKSTRSGRKIREMRRKGKEHCLCSSRPQLFLPWLSTSNEDEEEGRVRTAHRDWACPVETRLHVPQTALKEAQMLCKYA